MAQHPNGFAAPFVSYGKHLTELGLLSEGAYLPYLSKFPEMKGSYIMTAEAQPGVLIKTDNKKYFRWEDSNKPMLSFKVTSDVTGGSPGAAVSIQLDPDSYVGTTPSGTLSPIANGRTYVDNSTGTVYYAFDVSKASNGAHTAQLRPVKSADTAEISAETSFFMDYGRVSVEERSSPMDGVYRSLSKVEREVSAIREDKEFTDLASFESIDIDLDQVGTFRKWSMSNFDKEFIDKQELKLMFKESYDNIVDDVGMDPSADLGVVPTVKSAGTVLTTNGAFTDAYFENIKRIQSAHGRTKNFDVLAETDAIIGLQKYFESKVGVNGAVSYGTFGEGDLRLNLDFAAQIKYHGINLNLKEYEYFNASRTHGADIGQGYMRGAMLFIPLGEFRAPDNTFQKLFSIRYMTDPTLGTVVWTGNDGMLLGQGREMFAGFTLQTWKSVDVIRPWEYFYSSLEE